MFGHTSSIACQKPSAPSATASSAATASPGTFTDPLTEVLRNGARALLSQAVEAEVAALHDCHADKLTEDGRQRLVRHGHLPERETDVPLLFTDVSMPGKMDGLALAREVHDRWPQSGSWSSLVNQSPKRISYPKAAGFSGSPIARRPRSNMHTR